MNPEYRHGSEKDLAERLLDTYMRVVSLDELSVWGSERMMLGQLLYLRQPGTCSLPFIKSLKLDVARTSLKHLNHLQLIVQKRMAKSETFSDLRLATVRLVRRQNNLKMAERLLSEQIKCLSARIGLNNEFELENNHEYSKFN